MKLSVFQSQPLSQRFNTVCEWGFFMLRRKLTDHTIALFSVHGFFVEVILTHAGEAIAINGYGFEEMPLEYYRMVDTLKPFTYAAKPNAELLGEMGFAA